MRIMMITVFLGVSLPGFTGEISEYYFEHAANRWVDHGKSRTHDEVDSTGHGITEMGIERTRCFGKCPNYTFIVKSDGTFRYEGMEYVERKGKYTGTIPVPRFHALAQFVRDSGYLGCEDSYTRETTGASGTYSMVIMNGKRKVVRNYANAAPTKVWATEQLIDGLMFAAKWDERP
jgi:hypothetical protein